MKKVKVFSSKAEFERIYADCMDEYAGASKTVVNSESKMRECFDKYLDALEEDTFRHAYECGYRAALLKVGKGGAV